MSNDNNNFKYNFSDFKEQVNSFIKFAPEKNKIKQELTEEILGKKLLQFVGEKAIMVWLDHYCLSIDNENMYTSGIASCCAIFIEKDNKTFLMHISPKSQAEDIFNLLAMLSINRNAHISIFLGPAYKVSASSFDYTKLIEKLKSPILNNNIDVSQLSGEHGNIFVFGRDVYVVEEKEIEDKLSNKK